MLRTQKRDHNFDNHPFVEASTALLFLEVNGQLMIKILKPKPKGSKFRSGSFIGPKVMIWKSFLSSGVRYLPCITYLGPFGKGMKQNPSHVGIASLRVWEA